jgi:hypothetical protein
MPDEGEGAITQAVRDPEVKVIVLRGAGRAFCAGYDFGGGFHHWDELLSADGEWDPGKDFIGTTSTGTARRGRIRQARPTASGSQRRTRITRPALRGVARSRVRVGAVGGGKSRSVGGAAVASGVDVA